MENKDKINIPDLSKSSNSAEKGKSIKPRHKTQGKGGNTSVVEMEIYTNHTSNDIVPLYRKKTPTILPRNVAQEDYLYQLADPSTNIVFAVGPAGTSAPRRD